MWKKSIDAAEAEIRQEDALPSDLLNHVVKALIVDMHLAL